MSSTHFQLAHTAAEDLQDEEWKQGSLYVVFSIVIFHLCTVSSIFDQLAHYRVMELFRSEKTFNIESNH